MTTAANLIDGIIDQLNGYGSSTERPTALGVNISPTDLSFMVSDTAHGVMGITPGVVQIDSELLYVSNVDSNTGTITVAPFGRGFKSTAPAAHTAGAMVISQPRFPRSSVMRALNDVLGGVYPDLFVIKTDSTIVTYPTDTYTLPGSSRGTWVIDAQWQHPIGDWISVGSYQLDPFDGTLRSRGGMIGRPLRVIYAVEPPPFTSEGQDLTADIGLPASTADVLQLGVIGRMLIGLDMSRAQNRSVEQSDENTVVTPGAGSNASKYIMGEYQMRLKTEATSLRKIMKPKVRRVY